MSHEIFKHIPTIEYQGEDNDNPLAYNWYDAEKIILGKSLKEHLRFAVCYWHSFNWTGNDVFGEGLSIDHGSQILSRIKRHWKNLMRHLIF